jgi:hypothetical protein
MYALLALVVALCPSVQGGLDEHVLAALKDKFGEKLQVGLCCCCLVKRWSTVGQWLVNAGQHSNKHFVHEQRDVCLGVCAAWGSVTRGDQGVHLAVLSLHGVDTLCSPEQADAGPWLSCPHPGC